MTGCSNKEAGMMTDLTCYHEQLEGPQATPQPSIDDCFYHALRASPKQHRRCQGGQAGDDAPRGREKAHQTPAKHLKTCLTKCLATGGKAGGGAPGGRGKDTTPLQSIRHHASLDDSCKREGGQAMIHCATGKTSCHPSVNACRGNTPHGDW